MALNGCHRDLVYQGKKRTLSPVTNRFWWPGVQEAAENIVCDYKRCQACGEIESRAPVPLQLVHLDFTSFESTTNLDKMPEVKYVLVIVDHFTRYMRVYVTKDQKASTVWNCLYEGFISIFGAPEKLITNQGKAFTSEVVTELCTQFRAGKTTMMPYHLQGNGQVERAHQTLKTMIGKLEDEHKKQWPKHLAKLTHAYNSTRSAVTGYLLHFIMFIQKLRLPIDFLFPTHEDMSKMKPIDAYVVELIGTLRKAFKIARGITQEEEARQKQYYDCKASSMTFNTGDMVLVHNDHHVGHQKLKDHWEDDTYQVISHVDEDVPVYVIENKWGRRQTLHHNFLFLIGWADTDEVMARLFQTMSTMMLPETPHQEVNTECQLPYKMETDVNAQDTSGWRLHESMSNAVNCVSNTVGAVKPAIAWRWPHE